MCYICYSVLRGLVGLRTFRGPACRSAIPCDATPRNLSKGIDGDDDDDDDDDDVRVG